jgi:hypothetical protein
MHATEYGYEFLRMMAMKLSVFLYVTSNSLAEVYHISEKCGASILRVGEYFILLS